VNAPAEATSRRISRPSRAVALSVPRLLLASLVLGYLLFFSAYTLRRHAAFQTFAADLSYIDQPMWNTLHGRFLERTMDDRQVSRVAEHFEPILLPLALVFYAWDDVRALLILQTAALALGALPVYWIARRQLATLPAPVSRRSGLLALAFVLVYLMFPALQAANVADFHADPFVVAPLLFAFWYASQRRYAAMWAWAVAAMLVKENLPTLTFMLGLYLLFSRESPTPTLPGPNFSKSRFRGVRILRCGSARHLRMPHSSIRDLLNLPIPNPRRLHGLALVAVSLAWFYVATFLIVAPLARQVYGTPGPVYLASRYAGFEGGLAGLVGRAGEALALLGEPARLGYLAGLLASAGWLALLAPEYLLLGLPVLVANTFSNFPGQYSGEQHYSAPLAAVFVIAAVYGFRRLVALSIRVGGRLRSAPYALLALAWLLAWSLGYHHLRGWTPLARDFAWPQVTPHHRLLARFAGQIPAGASLSTTPPLHPHLAHREKIAVFPTLAGADFALIDVAERVDAHPNDVRAAFETLLESGEYGIVDAADGYVLLARGRAGGTELPDAFYDFARAPGARPEYARQVDFDGRLRLLGFDVLDDPKWGQTHLRLYWQALGPLAEELRVWPFVFDEAGALVEDTSQRPMVAPLWYPPARWRPGEIVVTQTLPWDLGDRFQVGLAVLRVPPGLDPAAAFADPAGRLPVTAAGTGVTLFHGDSWAGLGGFARDGRRLAPAAEDVSLQPVEAVFAGGLRLTGYRVADLEGEPAVVLRWLPEAPVARDYTVFVHLLAEDGARVGQSDAQPGWVVPWPAGRWSPARPVLDGHRLSLSGRLAPGRYRVVAGLYDWESLERLPLLDAAGQPAGDALLLHEFVVAP
jgi:uncharacterized membrane protein